MVILLDPSQRTEIVLSCDKGLPREQQTVFVARPISARVATSLFGAQRPEDREGLPAMLAVLRAGLVDWSGARDGSGAVVPFPSSQAEWDRVPDLFTMGDLIELTNAVMSASRLGEVERKNSESAQPS